MKSDIYKLIQTLSEDQMRAILKDDSVCISVFRNLPALAQHILLRTLYIDKNIYQKYLEAYSMTKKTENKAYLDQTLKTLRSLRLIQIETNEQSDGILPIFNPQC